MNKILIEQFTKNLIEDVRLHFRTQEVMKKETGQEFKFWNTYNYDISFHLEAFLNARHILTYGREEYEYILRELQFLENENIYYRIDKVGDLVFYQNRKENK